MFFVAYQISILDWGVETFRYCGAFQLGMALFSVFKYSKVFFVKSAPQECELFITKCILKDCFYYNMQFFSLVIDIN